MFAMNQISGHDQSRDIQYIQSIQKNVQPIWKNGDEKEKNGSPWSKFLKNGDKKLKKKTGALGQGFDAL